MISKLFQLGQEGALCKVQARTNRYADLTREQGRHLTMVGMVQMI